MKEYLIQRKIGPTSKVDILYTDGNDNEVHEMGIECANITIANLVVEALDARDLSIWNEEL